MAGPGTLEVSDDRRRLLVEALVRSFADGPAIGRALQDGQESLVDVLDVARGRRDVATDAVKRAIDQGQLRRLLTLAVAAAPNSLPLRTVAREIDPAIMLPASAAPEFDRLPAQLRTLSRADIVFGRESLVEALAELVGGAAPGTWIALHGLPGAGKTTLAAALSDRLAAAGNGPGAFGCVLETFVGRGDGTRPRERSLERCAEKLGVLGATTQNLPAEERALVLRRAIREGLDRQVGGRRVLVVVDDIWDDSDAAAHELGGETVYLVTTNDQAMASRLAVDPSRRLGRDQCRRLVPELSPEASAEMLRNYARAVVASDPDRAARLAASVGHLPFLLKLIGKQLQAVAPMEHSPRLMARQLGRIEDELAKARRQGLQDLDAALEACVKLIDGDGKAALARLSLFPPRPLSSFSDEAAMAVCAGAADGFDELAKRGLVASVPDDRYALHQIVSDYATRLLEGSPEAEDAIGAFVAFYVDLACVHAEDEATLALEIVNLGAAMDRAVERRDRAEFAERLVRGANACSSYFHSRGMYETARRYLEPAYALAAAMRPGLQEEVAVKLASHLEKLGRFEPVIELLAPFTSLASDLSGATAWTAQAFYVRAVIAYNQVRYDEAEAFIRRGLRVLDGAPASGVQSALELRARCDLLERLCLVHIARGVRGDAAAWDPALRCGVAGLALAKRVSDEPRRLVHVCNLAWVYRALGKAGGRAGRTRTLQRLARRGLERATRVYHAEHRTAFHHLLGVLARDCGDQDEAEEEFRAALRLARDTGHQWYQALAEIEVGAIGFERKRLQEALDAFGRAAEIAQRIGAADLEADARDRQQETRRLLALDRSSRAAPPAA